MTDRPSPWRDQCPSRGPALRHVKVEGCPQKHGHEGHHPALCCECGLNPAELRRAADRAAVLEADRDSVPVEPRYRTRLLADDRIVVLTPGERARLSRYVAAVEDRRGYR